jgi:ring-1,2-phenylacetyl-CoA epoxidase subunit PaaD
MERRRRDSACAHVFDWLDEVKDPEIPAVSIWELGVLQDVVEHDGLVTVIITPTYSGCPAMAHIEACIVECLQAHGAGQVVVQTRLAPAWSTDWMNARGKVALRNYGIAPPGSTECPQCGSSNTQVVSEFGSTACKALYRCLACREPFDHFKRI